MNFSEEGATELARLLLSRGVAVEAGLCDADAAEVLGSSGLAARCIRVLIEPQEQEMESALQTASAIEKVLLHDTEATAWSMMDEAIARGYGVRIWLEDTLFLPDGSLARNNTELVMEAVRRGQAASSGT